MECDPHRIRSADQNPSSSIVSDATVSQIEIYRKKIAELSKENELLEDENQECGDLLGHYENENRFLRGRLAAYEQTGPSFAAAWRGTFANILQPNRERLEAENSTLKQTVETQKDTISGLKLTISKKDTELHGLQSKNIALEESFAKAKAEMLQELQAAHDLNSRSHFKVSDSEIISLWNELGFKIKTFVNAYFPERIPADHEIPKDSLSSYLADQPIRFMSSPFLSRMIFGSMIWAYIHSRVFSSSSKLWAGKPGRDIQALFNLFQGVSNGSEDFLKKFHDWRARSAQWVSELSTCTPEQISKEANGLCKTVFQGILPKVEHESGIVLDSTKIIQTALELDLIFRKSKAVYFIVFKRTRRPWVDRFYGFRYCETYMDQTKLVPAVETPEVRVDLILSPGLFKTGTADGTKHKEQCCLVKQQVLCDSSRFFMED